MTKKENILENGWKLSECEEMEQAAECMTYEEFTEYRKQQKIQARKAMEELRHKFAGADAIYADVIVQEVGEKVFALLKRFCMIESCGVIQGRKLYAI